ncbi:MAG: C40 family peptidase [Alicyclobacillus sp.]|nr:C40 family peptidase [Alicyclobacillus sp.]
MRTFRLIAAACAVGCLCTSGVAYGASLSSEKALLGKLQSEASQTYQQISQDKSKATALQNAIQQDESSLANIRAAIRANEQQSAQVAAALTRLDEKLQQNQKMLTADKQDLEAQVRAMYEDGHVSYLSVLLNATSFSDLLSRIYLLEQIAKKQQDMIHEVAALRQTIAQQQGQQKTLYASLQQKHRQLQTYEQAQTILEQHQREALASVRADLTDQTRKRTTLESQIQLTQSQIQQIELETQQAEQLMQNQQYVQTTLESLPQVDAEQIIQYGEQFMGTPYVWGGTTPNPGFDCSGFVQYVFAHFGVSLYRTSEEQFAEGVPVSESDLQPGDLVFFSTYAPGATHVGIYIGNGMMLDSEDMGLTIDNIHNSYWGPKYLGARRVIKS